MTINMEYSSVGIHVQYADMTHETKTMQLHGVTIQKVRQGMKLIIEIPDHIYEMVTNTGTFGCYRFDTRKAIKNGTPIPDNATNGDVIKALFPNEHDFETDFDEDWWNAPYQKGGKE